MERLTGQDAAFLYNETPTQHMHTLKIAVLDPATIPDGYSFEDVSHTIEARLHLLPPFRRRVVDLPLRITHPWWIEDPHFRLEDHVHRVVLPAPGGHAAFDDLVSEIASRPLDRDKPLWELTVVEGMEGGHIGFVAKIHHCAADGAMAAELLANVFDLDPDAGDPPPPEVPWRPDPEPSRAQLLGLAARDILTITRSLPGLILRTLRGMLAVIRHRRGGGTGSAAPFSGPKTSFNGALTARRTFVTQVLSLDQIKRVKAAYGVTVNDVVLAMVTGALRDHLAAAGATPEKALVAGVPVSTRAGDTPLRANSVSTLFVSLPAHLAEPVAQMEAVHATTKGAKEQSNLLGVELLSDWSELTPPRPYSAAIRFYSSRNLADRTPPPINLVVSNVPGPRESLFIAGAELTAIYSMGPILEGIGLNVTVWSYRDELFAGVVSCPELLPDLRVLVERFGPALDRLEAAAPAA